MTWKMIPRMTELDKSVLAQAAANSRVRDDGQVVGQATDFESDGTQLVATVVLDNSRGRITSQLQVTPPGQQTKP